MGFLSRLSILLLLLSAISSCRNAVSDEGLIPIVEKALSDSSSIYYGDFSMYPDNLADLPIGIFDCSASGFEVVERILTLDEFDNITGSPEPDGIVDFGGENVQYLSDKANGPYGGYILSGNTAYLREQVVRDVLFLTGQKYYNLAVDEYMSGFKEPVKLVLVSSPVADLHCIGDINALLDRSGTGVKAVGVIESGIRKALSRAEADGDICIGVMSSPDGVTSREYETAIRRMAKEQGLSGNIQILNQEAVGLEAALKGDTAYIDPEARAARKSYAGPVTGISYNNIDMSLMDSYNFDTDSNSVLYDSSGKVSGMQLNSVENYVRFHIVSMIERHRRSGSSMPISSIILADGSFAQIEDVFREVLQELYDCRRGGIYLYRSSISPDFEFIDPAKCAAVEAYRILRADGNLALRGEKSRLMPFLTLPSGNLPQDAFNPDGSLRDEYKYSRESETEDVTTKPVPFAPRYVSPSVMSHIERNDPATYSLIRNSLY